MRITHLIVDQRNRLDHVPPTPVSCSDLVRLTSARGWSDPITARRPLTEHIDLLLQAEHPGQVRVGSTGWPTRGLLSISSDGPGGKMTRVNLTRIKTLAMFSIGRVQVVGQ